MEEEQRGDEIARAVDRDRQFWRAQAPEFVAVAGDHVERVGGRIVEPQRSDENDLRPPRAQRGERRARLRDIADRALREERQFERVGRQDGRGGQGALAHELRDPRVDVNAASLVADDGIAGIGGAPGSPP